MDNVSSLFQMFAWEMNAHLPVYYSRIPFPTSSGVEVTKLFSTVHTTPFQGRAPTYRTIAGYRSTVTTNPPMTSFMKGVAKLVGLVTI